MHTPRDKIFLAIFYLSNNINLTRYDLSSVIVLRNASDEMHHVSRDQTRDHSDVSQRQQKYRNIFTSQLEWNWFGVS